MFKLFKKKHICDFNKIVRRSNAIQFDEMGYPLRLCIVKCECGVTTQLWVDTGKRYEMKENDVEVLWDKEDKSE
jgi:hypothetical protein